MDEFQDKKIKDFFAKDNVIPEEANRVFYDTLEQIKLNEQKKKQHTNPMLYIRRWITAAACTLVIFVGANIYARTNGYNNIFFMIKDVWSDTNITKQEIFSDKDILISYQSFSITDYIEMQINELQIKDGKAKLYLYVEESKANEITPLKYKVFNEDGTLAYEEISNKKDAADYTEILELKKYKEDQKIITMQVLSKDDVLLKTVVINLEEKIIEARSENPEVKKISQIKLNEFLNIETKKATIINDNERILILKLTDINYNDSIYTVKYLYNKITDADIKDNKVEDSEIEEGIAKFVINNGQYILKNIEIDNKK